MKATDEKCCVCGEQAIEWSLDGTGWCEAHFRDWKNFLRAHRGEYSSLSDAFDAWLQQARVAMGKPIPEPEEFGYDTPFDGWP